MVSDNTSQSIEFVQVAYSMEDEEVRKREIRSIEKAAGYLKVDKATIVTFNESDELHLPGVKIDIVPAWR